MNSGTRSPQSFIKWERRANFLLYLQKETAVSYTSFKKINIHKKTWIRIVRDDLVESQLIDLTRNSTRFMTRVPDVR